MFVPESFSKSLKVLLFKHLNTEGLSLLEFNKKELSRLSADDCTYLTVCFKAQGQQVK